MKITNHTGLPAGLVRAIERDPYDNGGADITASQLGEPPQIIALRKRHEAELSEDASERIWALFGQALHVIAERGAALRAGVLSEARYCATVAGWKLSGQLDHHDLESGTLSDYKCTSAWTVVYGDRLKDWEAQLNTLAFLLARNNVEVRALEVVALLRDWAERDRARVGPKYPAANVIAIPLPLWPADEQARWVEERIRLHQSVQLRGENVPCTEEERWAKRERDGSTRYIRCEKYCAVGRGGVCPQWSAQKEAK